MSENHISNKKPTCPISNRYLNINSLKMDLYNYYGGKEFLKCKNMGELVQVCLDTISSN